MNILELTFVFPVALAIEGITTNLSSSSVPRNVIGGGSQHKPVYGAGLAWGSTAPSCRTDVFLPRRRAQEIWAFGARRSEHSRRCWNWGRLQSVGSSPLPRSWAWLAIGQARGAARRHGKGCGAGRARAGDSAPRAGQRRNTRPAMRLWLFGHLLEIARIPPSTVHPLEIPAAARLAVASHNGAPVAETGPAARAGAPTTRAWRSRSTQAGRVAEAGGGRFDRPSESCQRHLHRCCGCRSTRVSWVGDQVCPLAARNVGGLPWRSRWISGGHGDDYQP